MKTLLKSAVFFFMLSCVSFTSAFAQEEEAVTDEELKKYAVLMDSVEAMKNNVKGALESMVENKEDMTKSRYNDLTKAGDDEAKLEELEATEDELAFIALVSTTKDSLEQALTQEFRTMAMEYVTGKVYKKVKTALKSDKEVKARYDAIYEEVAAARLEESVEGSASSEEEVDGTNR